MPQGGPALTGQNVLLLPWYVTGQLSSALARQIGFGLVCDAGLARDIATIRHEQAQTVTFNNGLGVPSPRALLALFAAIDADEATANSSPDSVERPRSLTRQIRRGR